MGRASTAISAVADVWASVPPCPGSACGDSVGKGGGGMGCGTLACAVDGTSERLGTEGLAADSEGSTGKASGAVMGSVRDATSNCGAGTAGSGSRGGHDNGTAR